MCSEAASAMIYIYRPKIDARLAMTCINPDQNVSCGSVPSFSTTEKKRREQRYRPFTDQARAEGVIVHAH